MAVANNKQQAHSSGYNIWVLAEAKICSTKIGSANALSLGTNSCKKRNVGTLNSAHQTKKVEQF